MVPVLLSMVNLRLFLSWDSYFFKNFFGPFFEGTRVSKVQENPTASA